MTRHPRGAALLLVMWLILLLSGLVAGYAMAARIESLQGNGLARSVAAREAARAGVEIAVSRLIQADPALRWPPDGSSNAVQFEGAQIEVEIRDETGKIDLNAAAPELLAGLFSGLGEPRGAATRLAGAIVDWRDEDTLTQPAGGAEDADYASAGLAWGAKDAPFETVAEVEQVLGMRPGLYAAAAPYLTVYSGSAIPERNFAEGAVLAAMGTEGPEGPPPLPGVAPTSGSGTYSVRSRVRLPNGRSAQLSVILRAGGNGLPGSTYTPLRWQDGAESP